jgi:hypothetical protein
MNVSFFCNVIEVDGNSQKHRFGGELHHLEAEVVNSILLK